MFDVLWQQGEVKGYRDLLPSEWFYDGSYRVRAEHRIIPRKMNSTNGAI